MGNRILHLIRHGDYLEGETEDGLGNSLSDRGQQQAGKLAEFYDEYRLAAIHTSPAPRAIETARMIAERHPGLVLQRHWSLFECVPSVPPTVTPWGEPDELSPGAVSNCRERLDRHFDRSFKSTRGQERHEILVCHGNVIRYFVTRALGVDANSWVSMRCSQASVTRVVVSSGTPRFVLESLNDLSHLPANLRAVDD